MAKSIVVFIDPKTREVEVHVPLPENGPVQIEADPNAADKFYLRFDKASIEQKAHYRFWENGMKEQIRDILRVAPRATGVRGALQWILEMRIAKIREKTGFTYSLFFSSEAPASRNTLAAKEDRCPCGAPGRHKGMCRDAVAEMNGRRSALWRAPGMV